MAEIENIKDMSPNPALVGQLERLLQEAKEGKIRSAVWLTAWDDDCVSHGWAYDKRTTPRRILAEMVLMQHDFVVNIELFEGDSILAKSLEDQP